ncbi:hypothetical protein Pfo_020501 [Paulownia fortunei]|nr:hypothetical protein Pfo_020501 [Paulownia fortunei]
MSNCQRSTSYSHEEDLHLCHIYLEISQNLIIGINQSKEQFWSRVESEYNNTKLDSITQYRPKRSLQSRMQVIMALTGKMRGCIRQVENLHLSGASEQDVILFIHIYIILQFFRAKMMLQEDKNFKKGFKFDHVWPILKDTKKFGNEINISKPVFQSQSSSQGLSSFSLNINEENVDGTSTQRPIGVKKAKLKRKNEEESTKFFEAIRHQHQQVAELFKQGSEDRQQFCQIQMIRAQNESKKLAMVEYREENKILLKDLNSINDPNLREFFQNEQSIIMLKRAQQHSQESQSSFGSFGQYFDDLVEPENDLSKNDLPDY